MALKDRVIVKFPAIVNAATGIGKTVVNGVYEFFMDVGKFVRIFSVPDTTVAMVMVYTPDPADPNANGQYNLMSIADFSAGASLKVQIITNNSDPILSDTNIALFNKAVDGPSTHLLPIAANKAGAVLAVDWKGNADDTNYIEIKPSGSETYQGGSTSWKINGNAASVSFRPVPTIGYAV